MKLLITAPFTENCREELKKFYEEVIYIPWTLRGNSSSSTEEELNEMFEKYDPDALIVENDQITGNLLQKFPKIRVIGDCRANPVNIDIEACTRLGIPVFAAPARNAEAVAELLTGSLISFLRHINESIRWIEDGKWVPGNPPYSTFTGSELYGKKIGFVGFGAVGRTTARIMEGFCCDISFYDPFVTEYKETYKKKELEDIFRDSDIVSIHLPVLESTKGMIGKDLLGLMKSDAIFINTARSAVVVTEDLYAVLSEKKIRGAVLDVLDHEPPLEEDLRFASLPNVLLTPHIAGASMEVFAHHSRIITDRFLMYFRKEELEKIVYNRDVIPKL